MSFLGVLWRAKGVLMVGMAQRDEGYRQVLEGYDGA